MYVDTYVRMYVCTYIYIYIYIYIYTWEHLAGEAAGRRGRGVVLDAEHLPERLDPSSRNRFTKSEWLQEVFTQAVSSKAVQTLVLLHSQSMGML